MSYGKAPPCFCSEEAALSCDWKLNITMEYSREGHPEAVTSKVEWDLDKIPHMLAQALLQANVAVVNEKGIEVYAAWAKGCFDGDTPEQMVERVKEMIA